MTLDQIITAANATPGANGSYKAKCPVHEDRTPSLSISEGRNGNVLVHCHAGCETAAIVEAWGLAMSDLRSEAHPNGSARILDRYAYHDLDGKVLMEIVRWDGIGKRCRRPDGQGGWISNVKGVPRVLYNLPGIAKAPMGTTVFYTEGESDADALIREGMIATTNPFGAGQSVDDDSILDGRPLVIVPDHNESGQRHALAVARRMHGRSSSLKIVDLPGLTGEDGNKDLRDWLKTHSVEDLDTLGEKTMEWSEPVGEPLDEAGAKKYLQEVFEITRGIAADTFEVCDQLASFYARKGLDVLPVSYVATGMNVTPGRVYQLISAGQSHKRLSTNVDDELFEQVTEAHLRPLAKLEPAEQADGMSRAFQIARESHAADQAERETEGRAQTKLRLLATHVQKAVREILPRGREDDDFRELLSMARKTYDLAMATPGCPSAIVGAARDLKRLIQERTL